MAGVEPAERLEVIFRLHAVHVAAERGDHVAVCEEGEAYLACPDPHLDLVTARPNVHLLVAESWYELGQPGLAVEHYRMALLGAAHLVRPADEVEAALARAEALAGGQGLDEDS